MDDVETVTHGRSRRSNAGNRMRELLEKAHQEDDDELFKEEEDDAEFDAPQDIRDVYLDDFADTDDEVELDSDDEERRLRREERRKAKGKGKATYDPFAAARPKKPKWEKTSSPSGPTHAERLVELDPTLDPSTMAQSTILMTLRRLQREQKRKGRSEAVRSTLRKSTLATAVEQKEETPVIRRKGRTALHEGGEMRGSRPMTQDELIAAALEEEERNREALQDWVKREEAKRELRRVGRKRVKGPKWTYISRTVNRLVEEVEQSQDTKTHNEKDQSEANAGKGDGPAPAAQKSEEEKAQIQDKPEGSTSASAPAVTAQQAKKSSDKPAEPSQYARNYIILSQIPGGLPEELKLILGDHAEWDQMKYIPHRSRPINRRPIISPFSGQPAKYRHPQTLIPYATIEEARTIDALLAHRYIWSDDAGCWFGGEEDIAADVAADIPGWFEAANGGWLGGKEILEEELAQEMEVDEPAEAVEAEPVEVEPEPIPKKGKKGKRASMAAQQDAVAASESEGTPDIRPNKKAKGKLKRS